MTAQDQGRRGHQPPKGGQADDERERGEALGACGQQQISQVGPRGLLFFFILGVGPLSSQYKTSGSYLLDNSASYCYGLATCMTRLQGAPEHEAYNGNDIT